MSSRNLTNMSAKLLSQSRPASSLTLPEHGAYVNSPLSLSRPPRVPEGLPLPPAGARTPAVGPARPQSRPQLRATSRSGQPGRQLQLSATARATPPEAVTSCDPAAAEFDVPDRAERPGARHDGQNLVRRTGRPGLPPGQHHDRHQLPRQPVFDQSR